MVVHAPSYDIGERIQRRATVVIHHPFWVAGCAGCIVQADRVPFVLRKDRFKRVGTFGQQGLIGDRTDATTTFIAGVFDVDDQHVVPTRHLDRPRGNFGELGIHNHGFGLCVIEDEGNRFGVQTGVHRVQHRPAHRYAKMGFKHFWKYWPR